MIPEVINLTEQSDEQPSLTFKIDFDKNKIVGMTDNLEAVKQAVFLILSTERNYSPIYKDYGINYDDLIGKDKYFVISELKRRVAESLKEDDRINDVQNFKFNDVDDGLELTFEIISIYGNFVTGGVFNV